MKVNILIERGPDAWWASSADEVLKGSVTATGNTRDEAITKFRSMMQDHLAYLTDEGHDAPQVTELEIHELMAV